MIKGYKFTRSGVKYISTNALSIKCDEQRIKVQVRNDVKCVIKIYIIYKCD
jgi:hypothetical protein